MRPGDVVGGDFRIVRPLSAGGMGSVFVAEQISTGRQRALKLMHASLVSDPKMRERFVQEARISATIESDHVVEVVAAGVDANSGAPYLAMELLQGEDLASYLTRRGALDATETSRILAQACHGIGAAHARGIVHRDLKPENLFLARGRRLGADMRVLVLDFGIARQTTELATAAIGTPLWMAPEQSQTHAGVSPATDVWPLGLMTFQMLAGAHYWNAVADSDSTVLKLMREMLLDDLEPPSARLARRGSRIALPPGFDAWFARAVVRDPRARFPDATAAFAALRPILAGAASAMQTSADAPEAIDPSAIEEVDEWLDAELAPESDTPLEQARARFDAAPRRADLARAILGAARAAGDRDLAFRAAATLATFKSASPGEEAIASDAAFARPPITRPLDDAAWSALLHPSLSAGLVGVLATLAPALARASAPLVPPRELEGAQELDRSHAATHPIALVVFRAIELLGLPVPRVFLRAQGAAPIHVLHGERPSCVVSAGFFAILSPPQSLFVAARSLARLRPELHAAHFFGATDHLRSLVETAASVARRARPDPANARVAAMLEQHLRPPERAALTARVERLLASQSTADLAETIRAAHMTAARAGLLLAGDLKLAFRELTRSPPAASIVATDDVVDDLLRFWLGPTCSTLRQRHR